MESVQQTLNGAADFNKKVTATISRNGDLVGRMYVECDPSAVLAHATFAPNPLHQLLKEMTVEIGGQQIDKQYGHWLNVWTELTEPTNVSILDSNGQYAAAVTTRGTDTEARVPPTPYQRMAFGVKSGGVTPDEKKKQLFLFNSGSVVMLDWLFHLLLFNTTKLRFLLHSIQKIM